MAHSIDVAAVAGAMLELRTWRRRLERLAGRALDALDIERLIVLAFWHDVGKCGAGFQAKALDDGDRRATGIPFAQSGHTRVVAPLVTGRSRWADRLREALGIDAAMRWWGDGPLAEEFAADLWLAAVSHHGEPISVHALTSGTDDFAPTWSAAIGGYRPIDGLRELGGVARRLWPRAFEPEASRSLGEPFVHAFAGLVSLADWIASNAEADFFPYDLAAPDERRWDTARPRARQVLRAMRLDIEDARADLAARRPSFAEVFGEPGQAFEASAVQRAAADLSLESPLVLEAETGSGKTEAALWRFKALFESGAVDALCFLLPTRVAATGIARRIDMFIGRMFPDPALRPNTVLAIPGDLRANGRDGSRLAGFEVLWPDDRERRPMYWAAENSKRYFAAWAAAATIDQFLLSALTVKHAHLRAGVLLRSLVVVDEVHASDPYMLELLEAGLRRHLAAGGHAMLLSATLPADRRAELLACTPDATAAAASGRPWLGRAAGGRAVASESQSAQSYPRLADPRRVADLGRPRTDGRVRRIHCELKDWLGDPDAIAELAVQKVRQGARVLVLRNTVRQAVAVQRAIESQLGADHPALFRLNGVVAMHHGRYALDDRRALDRQVEHDFGKQAAEVTVPRIVCATQTLEISVDCDADFLITDLAPMDVLLQRLGRLHRHARRDPHRPAGFAEPRCVVLTPPRAIDGPARLALDGLRGSGLGRRGAYANLPCVEATWRALDDRSAFPVLEIPRDNRALVERTCSRRAMEAQVQELGGAWPALLQELQGKHSAERGQAWMASIDWSKPWREAAGGELSVEARTRLGLDGIDFDLGPLPRSPFGHRIGRLTIPAWMLPAAPADAHDEPIPSARGLRESPEGFEFEVRGRPFAYGRLGLVTQGLDSEAAARDDSGVGRVMNK